MYPGSSIRMGMVSGIRHFCVMIIYRFHDTRTGASCNRFLIGYQLGHYFSVPWVP